VNNIITAEAQPEFRQAQAHPFLASPKLIREMQIRVTHNILHFLLSVQPYLSLSKASTYEARLKIMVCVCQFLCNDGI